MPGGEHCREQFWFRVILRFVFAVLRLRGLGVSQRARVIFSWLSRTCLSIPADTLGDFFIESPCPDLAWIVCGVETLVWREAVVLYDNA